MKTFAFLILLFLSVVSTATLAAETRTGLVSARIVYKSSNGAQGTVCVYNDDKGTIGQLVLPGEPKFCPIQMTFERI